MAREAVRALLDGRDVLAVMPTGSGKSAIYQLAALELPGPTVVVSPLVDLQRDQVEAIARRRLAGAAQANATLPAGERRQAIEDFSQGDLEFRSWPPSSWPTPTPSSTSSRPSRRCWWWTRPTASAPGATTFGLRRFFAGGAQLGVDQLEQVAQALEPGRGRDGKAELRQATGLSRTKLDRRQPARAGRDTRGRGRPRGGPPPGRAVRIEMLRGYAEDDACRRELLLTYFGEPFEPPCGACDNCHAGLADGPRPDPDDLAFAVDARVRHKSWGPGRVLRYDGDRMVVLFDRAGYRTLSVATGLERKLLRAR